MRCRSKGLSFSSGAYGSVLNKEEIQPSWLTHKEKYPAGRRGAGTDSQQAEQPVTEWWNSCFL